jgi:hypothetical protein
MLRVRLTTVIVIAFGLGLLALAGCAPQSQPAASKAQDPPLQPGMARAWIAASTTWERQQWQACTIVSGSRRRFMCGASDPKVETTGGVFHVREGVSPPSAHGLASRFQPGTANDRRITPLLLSAGRC